MPKRLLALVLTSVALACAACSHPRPVSNQIWSPDLGDGTYKNPIIYADYSDPDVLRVGNDFYLTASSFTCFPGLPILHSKDLVNWTIINHAIQKYPLPGFDTHINGAGVWAPSFRYHDGYYYIFFGDPDFGVFMTKTKDPAAQWDPLVCVKRVKGWIDTCPLWDDDGNVYLVHAFAGSRSGGISNVLQICRLSSDASSVIDDGQFVIDGKSLRLTTVEGPKFYKRNGYYYILAPGGGVTRGYQVAFRSKNVFGPYESRIVMRQGDTPTNGPHQGGWVTTPSGQDWFVHFQDAGAYGRITHLEPMHWVDDWPVIGLDATASGAGQPAMVHNKPDVGAVYPIQVPQTSDDFSSPTLGLQWQWFGNYQDNWISLTDRPGFLRMDPVPSDKPLSLFQRANLLLQKFPAPQFAGTAKLDASALGDGETAGILVTGTGTAALVVRKDSNGLRVSETTTPPPARRKHVRTPPPGTVAAHPEFLGPINAENQGAQGADPRARLVRGPAATQPNTSPPDIERESVTLPNVSAVFLRIEVKRAPPTWRLDVLPSAQCTLSYSTDGQKFTTLGPSFTVSNNGWIGAKIGVFWNAPVGASPTGHADFDYFHIDHP